MTTTQITKPQANAIARNAAGIERARTTGGHFVLSSLSRRGDLERLTAAGVVVKRDGDWYVAA